MRMSTAHSMPEEDQEVRAPASSSSSLTQGNLDHMTASASAAVQPPPSPSAASQPAGSFVASHSRTQQQQQQPSLSVALQPSSNSVTGQQQTQQQQQQMSHALPKGQTVTSPIQQAVDVHPLQAELQQPAATSTQEGTRDLHQPGTYDGAQAQDQNLGTSAQAQDGEGMSGGAAFGAWASAEHHSEWAVMVWVACEALPALIRAVRMVGPHTETEALRYLVCLLVSSLFACLSTCLSLCVLTSSLHLFVVLPSLCSSWALRTNWRPIDNCIGWYTDTSTTLCRRCFP